MRPTAWLTFLLLLVWVTPTPVAAQVSTRWPQHSMDRPAPPVVSPAPPTAPAAPPSDAVVLFYGRDLSQWVGDSGQAAPWKVENGYFEVVPKTGATLFFDSMAVPVDAPHPHNAMLFINYILRPEVHASLTNKVFYANPNKASMKFVKKDVAENKTIFLTQDEMSRMAVPDMVPQEIRRVETRVFQSFRTGH